MKTRFVLFAVLALVFCAGTRGDDTYTKLKAALLNGYDADARPGSPSTAVPLEIGMYITTLRIEEWHSALHANAFLSLQWTDERLQWSPEDFSGIKILRVPPTSIWVPDASLQNELPSFTFATKAEEKLVLIDSNGTVLWVPNVAFKSTCKLNLANFPVDEHECSLVLGSWTYDKSEIDIKLAAKPINKMAFVESSAWVLLESSAKENDLVFPDVEGVYPNTEFTFRLGRRGNAFWSTLYAPIAACLIAGLTITYAKPNGKSVLGVILATIANIGVMFGVLAYHRDALNIGGSDAPRILQFVGCLIALEALLLPLRVLSWSFYANKRSCIKGCVKTPPIFFNCLTRLAEKCERGRCHATSNSYCQDTALTSTEKKGQLYGKDDMFKDSIAQQKFANCWGFASTFTQYSAILVHSVVILQAFYSHTFCEAM